MTPKLKTPTNVHLVLDDGKGGDVHEFWAFSEDSAHVLRSPAKMDRQAWTKKFQAQYAERQERFERAKSEVFIERDELPPTSSHRPDCTQALCSGECLQ